jgi:hypothetical protein
LTDLLLHEHFHWWTHLLHHEHFHWLKKNPVRNASDEECGEMQAEDLKCYIIMSCYSPVKLKGVVNRNSIGYGKRKVLTSKYSCYFRSFQGAQFALCIIISSPG